MQKIKYIGIGQVDNQNNKQDVLCGGNSVTNKIFANGVVLDNTIQIASASRDSS